MHCVLWIYTIGGQVNTRRNLTHWGSWDTVKVCYQIYKYYCSIPISHTYSLSENRHMIVMELLDNIKLLVIVILSDIYFKRLIILYLCSLMYGLLTKPIQKILVFQLWLSTLMLILGHRSSTPNRTQVRSISTKIRSTWLQTPMLEI